MVFVMDILSNFAESLKELIAQHNINIKILAKDIGVDATCITHYLHGYCNPTLDILVRLADYFNCSTDFLLGLKDEDTSTAFKRCPPFDEQFKFLLKNFNYTCYKLANAAKIHQSSVYAWKNSKRIPTLDNVIKLAEIFGCRVDFVLGRQN